MRGPRCEPTPPWGGRAGSSLTAAASSTSPHWAPPWKRPALEPTKPYGRSSSPAPGIAATSPALPLGRSINRGRNRPTWRKSAGAADFLRFPEPSRDHDSLPAAPYGFHYFLVLMILGWWSILNSPFKASCPL